ncbi:MAG TPA: CCA tRNA nucleotidyltransferase [Caulobacteraceae bacterium]|jgi:poly(A) polymerase|nr:CCA tRNA nucleotidyltransferase [Caulobacteraceae bacterium]
MTETLPVQPWMAHRATAAVMAALEAAGGEDCARFVGGCVRNALLRCPVSDVDIATTLEPPEVTAALEAAGVRAIPTGIDHGTITAVADGRPFEITTLRRDVETDGRRAVVAFTRDWAEDAARRDFRLNALYADARGRLFDPTGGGIEDVRRGAIVFVGDARTRIREDALRIARFYRFLAWYGRGEPNPEALAACAELAPLVETLSAERIGAELMKLLTADDPRRAVRLMDEAGVLRRLAPRAVDLARFDSLVGIETEILFEQDPLLRLAALLPQEPQAGMETAWRLRLSNADRDRLDAALGAEPRLVSWMSPREMRRIVYRLGAETFCDRVLLSWAGSDRPAAAVQWRALLPMARTWTPPSLPLNGDEVAAAGVPHGPQIGAVLREVETWWIDQDFPDDKLSVMERLKAVVQGMVY